LYYTPLDAGYSAVGTRYGARETSITGGAFIQSGTGAIIIAIDEHFDFGSGTWLHPHGTTVINWKQKTYDTTYHGYGTPINVTGSVSAYPCPIESVGVTEATVTDLDDDPNAGY